MNIFKKFFGNSQLKIKEETKMKITVVCAAGKQGQKLVEEALNRGHNVKAVVRKKSAVPAGAEVLEKDLFDLTLNDLKDSDVVIDAFGAWTEETLPQQVLLLNICVIFFQARIFVC